MEPLRAIIVDDEEGAHLVLTHFIKEVKTLTLAGTFFDAVEAIDYIYKHKVDVVFLDINMPGLSGLEMLEAMSQRPFIILTTAYKEYALQSYQYDVVDYLVKPFDLKKFLSSIDKLLNRLKSQKPAPAPLVVKDYLMLKVDGNLIKILFSNILYIQSYGNYVKVFTHEAMFITQSTTQEVEEKLDENRFMRIHKSFIVSLDRIAGISGTELNLENGTKLPLGNTYKRKLLEYFR